MSQRSRVWEGDAEKVVKGIRRNTRRELEAEENNRVVLEGLRDPSSIAGPHLGHRLEDIYFYKGGKVQ